MRPKPNDPALLLMLFVPTFAAIGQKFFEATWNIISLCVLFGCLVLGRAASPRTPRREGAFLLFATIALLAAFYVFGHGPNSRHILSLSVLSVVIAITIKRSAPAFVQALRVVAVGAPLLVATFALLFPDKSYVLGRLGGPFHPQGLGIMLGQSAAIILTLGRGRMWRSEKVALVVIVAMLYMAHSRTAMAAAAFAVAVYFWQPWRRAGVARGIAIAAISLTLGFAAFSSSNVQRFLARGNAENLTTFTGRTAIWRLVFRAIQQRPWTGMGNAYNVRIWRSDHDFYSTTYGAHNLYLSLASRFGIPSAVLVVGLMAVAAARARRLAGEGDGEQARLAQATLVVGSVVFVSSFTEHGVLEGNWPWGLMTWATVAWILTAERMPRAEIGDYGSKRLDERPQVTPGQPARLRDEPA